MTDRDRERAEHAEVRELSAHIDELEAKRVGRWLPCQSCGHTGLVVRVLLPGFSMLLCTFCRNRAREHQDGA